MGATNMNDVTTIIKQYWPAIVALVAFATALLVLIIKWQTIQANRIKTKTLQEDWQERSAKRDHAAGGMRFEKIRVDPKNRYWAEWEPSSSIATVSPSASCPSSFSANCKQFFHVTEVVSHADPSFDVILFNPGEREASLLAVGVRVERVIHYSYTLPVAGDMPRAERLLTSEEYSVNMPDISSRVRHLDFDDSDTPAEINELVKKECDPYVLQPGARFRYTLSLRHYAECMPSDAILRLWFETNDGDKESHELYVRYAIGFSKKPPSVP
jgi:hypothetical protein